MHIHSPRLIDTYDIIRSGYLLIIMPALPTPTLVSGHPPYTSLRSKLPKLPRRLPRKLRRPRCNLPNTRYDLSNHQLSSTTGPRMSSSYELLPMTRWWGCRSEIETHLIFPLLRRDTPETVLHPLGSARCTAADAGGDVRLRRGKVRVGRPCCWGSPRRYVFACISAPFTLSLPNWTGLD